MLATLIQFTLKLIEAIELLGGIHIIIYLALGSIIIWILTTKKYRADDKIVLTEQEKKECIDEWKPIPLVPVMTEEEKFDLKAIEREVDGPCDSEIIVSGKKLINGATFNFLGLSHHPSVVEAAVKCLRRYGPGSCGPRGFYGSLDIHVELEKVVSNFLGTEATALYSSGYAVIASVIAAFSKRSDFLIIDDHCRHAIQQGVVQSRSRTFIYKHGDIEDLEKKMKECLGSFARSGVPGRRLLIAEGICLNTGNIYPLDKVIPLARKYKFRIILDDSFALGVLGKTGRGTCEHLDIPVHEVDMVLADIGNSIASIGGFCAGRTKMINHQLVNGSGYVFSASNPPMMVGGALEAFRQLQENPEFLQSLRENATLARQTLKKKASDIISIGGADISPVIHLRFKEPLPTYSEESQRLGKVIEYAENAGVCLCKASYAAADRFRPSVPSIRMTVMSTMSSKMVQTLANRTAEAFRAVLSGSPIQPIQQHSEPHHAKEEEHPQQHNDVQKPTEEHHHQESHHEQAQDSENEEHEQHSTEEDHHSERQKEEESHPKSDEENNDNEDGKDDEEHGSTEENEEAEAVESEKEESGKEDENDDE